MGGGAADAGRSAELADRVEGEAATDERPTRPGASALSRSRGGRASCGWSSASSSSCSCCGGARLAASAPAAAALPVRSGDLIVLDLSASVSQDTFSRIGETLRRLVQSGGRYGLVVFSSVAYEALPPGTPASALKPLVRYFTLPAQTGPGEAADLPDQPVELELQQRHADLGRARPGAPDPPREPPRTLAGRARQRPGRRPRGRPAAEPGGDDGVRPQPYAAPVVALNAAPDDAAFFARIADAAIAGRPGAGGGRPAPPAASTPAGAVPTGLLAAIAAVACLLAAHALWTARLRWRPATEPVT